MGQTSHRKSTQQTRTENTLQTRNPLPSGKKYTPTPSPSGK